MRPFTVALVALDGHTVPAWVAAGLADAGLHFVAEECTSREQLARVAGDADVVWVFGPHRCLTAENLEVLTRCGAIIRTGSGTDNVPVAEATARGIVVANTPDAMTEPVSDHAIGLLFAVVRQIPSQDRAVRAGRWDRRLAWPQWHLHDQTLGLVGFGRIAQRVAHKLSTFAMQVLASDPLVDTEVMARHNVTAVALDDLLAQSDFVSLHCPLTPATYHLIGERELGLMKPKAVLINTARGALVDEVALYRALVAGHIAAAGLDVLEHEPPSPDNPLLGLDNVVITSHVAGYSDEFEESMWRLSMETAIDLARGRWPRSYVNRGVKPRWQTGLRSYQ